MDIIVKSLSAGIPSSQERLYSEIDIDFPSGTISAVSGPNGVGKSSLLRIICGLKHAAPSNGQTAVRFSKEKSPYLAYVPQDYSSSLLPWMTVDDNIAIPLNITKQFSRKQVADRLNDLKDRFNCSFGNKFPGELSGGQRQITALLRAIIRIPDAVIIDEPFSALDTYSGLTFRTNYINYLREKFITTIFISHRIWEAVRLADRIIFINRFASGSSTLSILDFPQNHRVKIEDMNYIADWLTYIRDTYRVSDI